MAVTLREYDSARHLDTPEARAGYLTEALESEDAAFIAHAIGVVARAEGMTKVAAEGAVGRETLYRSLSADGNPSLKTVLSVLKSVGLQLTAKAAR